MKKKNRVFKVLFWVFFICFLIIYFAQLTGYYEYSNYQKSTMTEKQIEQFEKDVANGKEVDLDTYLSVDTTKYDNKFSDLASSISKGISQLVTGGVENSFRLINNLVND